MVIMVGPPAAGALRGLRRIRSADQSRPLTKATSFPGLWGFLQVLPPAMPSRQKNKLKEGPHRSGSIEHLALVGQGNRVTPKYQRLQRQSKLRIMGFACTPGGFLLMLAGRHGS